MAKLGGVVSGFVPEEPPKPEKKVSKKRPFITLHCDCCGHEEDYSVHKAKKWYIQYTDDGKGEDLQFCHGCTTFFGLADDSSFGSAYTSDSPDEAKSTLDKIRESKYLMISKTMRFGGTKTGMDIEVNFGDVFTVLRAGSDNQNELGTSKATFNASTVDIQIGPEVLTLYTHEIIPISWLNVMGLRKDGIIEEQFLSKDCQGYFAPTKDGKELLVTMFGNR